MSASTAIPAFRFDTNDYPAETRVDLWREIVSTTHEVTPLDSGAIPANSSYNLWSLGAFAVSSGSFWAQSFTRSIEAIRRDQIDHIGLFVQGNGVRYSRIGETEAILGQYDIQITDFAQPETSLATTGDSGTLYIPRDLAEEFLPAIGEFHGQVLGDSTANLLAHHILGLGQHLPGIPAFTVPHLTQATMELALALLQSLHTGSLETTGGTDLAMRHRVEHYIESQIGRPNLSPASIALACGISRSSLYRLFEPHDGIMGYVKRRRLHRIHAILLASNDHRSLANICQDHGFQSSAHFSREFRKEFGYPPSDIRGDNRLPDLVINAGPASSVDLILRSLHS